MPDPASTPERLPPFRTALVIIGITIACVLVFRYTFRAGPAPSVDDIPAPMALQVDTQQEIVIDPGSIPSSALRDIVIIPTHSHAFLRAIAYALVEEFKPIPGLHSVGLLPDLPVDKSLPDPEGLQLNLEITSLNESGTIESRSLVSALRIELHIPQHDGPLPALEIHQRAEISGAETPTIWYREAAAAIAPGIVSNIVNASDLMPAP